MDPRTGRFASQDPYGGRAQDPPSLHRYLYASNNPVNRFDPGGRESEGEALTAGGLSTTLSAISSVGRLGQALYYEIALNYFALERALVLTQAAFATGAAALEASRLALNLVSANVTYPSGSFPRGLQVGRVAGQNLADNFPLIDDWDAASGTATSIKSTTAIADRAAFLRNVQNWVAELDQFPEDGLRGQTASGATIRILASDVRSKALVVAIPANVGVNWNVAEVLNEVQQMGQVFETEIEIVPVTGLVPE